LNNFPEILYFFDQDQIITILSNKNILNKITNYKTKNKLKTIASELKTKKNIHKNDLKILQKLNSWNMTNKNKLKGSSTQSLQAESNELLVQSNPINKTSNNIDVIGLSNNIIDDIKNNKFKNVIDTLDGLTNKEFTNFISLNNHEDINYIFRAIFNKYNTQYLDNILKRLFSKLDISLIKDINKIKYIFDNNITIAHYINNEQLYKLLVPDILNILDIRVIPDLYQLLIHRKLNINNNIIQILINKLPKSEESKEERVNLQETKNDPYSPYMKETQDIKLQNNYSSILKTINNKISSSSKFFINNSINKSKNNNTFFQYKKYYEKYWKSLIISILNNINENKNILFTYLIIELLKDNFSKTNYNKLIILIIYDIIKEFDNNKNKNNNTIIFEKTKKNALLSLALIMIYNKIKLYKYNSNQENKKRSNKIIQMIIENGRDIIDYILEYNHPEPIITTFKNNNIE